MKKATVAVLCILVSIICASCATQLETSKQNLVLERPHDGIVFGSILVKNDLPETKKSWGGLLSPLTRVETSSFNYRLELHKKIFLGEPTYNLDVELNNERHFIFKFEEGEYCTRQLIPMMKGSFMAGSLLRLPIDLCFDVTAGKTSYIGELIIHLPEYLQSGFGTVTNVVDNKDRSISELEKEQDVQLKETITRLMHGR
jgi:hypothetical protein